VLLSARTTITIPDELKAKVEEYNKKNPYDKINISQVTQKALSERLKEATA
jgi:hypothetical protein